tara:strand:- start:4 stop:198 length:195 start_codon:yes stop_codon:yes gene_type:complete
MKIQDIKNRSLYFNRASQRVERVRSKANSNSVLTTAHDSEVSCVPAAKLRRASKQQFQKYLDAS